MVSISRWIYLVHLLVSFLTSTMILAFRENLVAINDYTVNVYMKALDRKKA